MTSDPLVFEFEVRCSVEHAFDTWCRRTSLWWPKSHSRSGDPELEVVIEGRIGGAIYERTSGGEKHVWGEVTAWEPPNRLAYAWHIYGSREEATDVEIRFAGREGETLVTIVHAGWERLGERGGDLRERNTNGWKTLQGSFLLAASPDAGKIEQGAATRD